MKGSEDWRSLHFGDVWRLPSRAVVPAKQKDVIRFASFNIERGYHAQKQQQYIRDNHLDVVLLQEVDIGCKRTGSINVLATLAGDEAFDGVYAVEFEEIDSPLRSAHLVSLLVFVFAKKN
jgi:hypothetical protein